MAVRDLLSLILAPIARTWRASITLASHLASHCLSPQTSPIERHADTHSMRFSRLSRIRQMCGAQPSDIPLPPDINAVTEDSDYLIIDLVLNWVSH